MTAAYDAIAEWYDQSVRKRALLPADDLAADVFQALGSIENSSVCDLACGQSEMARQLARRGATVTGVDISQKLLDIALREEAAQPMDITYVKDDAQLLGLLSDAAFDGVFCNMALMDIPDLHAAFRSVRRILRPKGWFAFTITHPCFQSPPARSYYEEGFWQSNNPHGVRGQVGAHHRTLSTYLNALSEASLFVEGVSEPRLPGRDIPVVLSVVCRASTI